MTTEWALKVTVIEDAESYCVESNSGGSRDSGVPTTILQDTSIATESRSNYQQVLTSNFTDLQFEGIIGQGRFSTVWKCTTNTKVSSSFKTDFKKMIWILANRLCEGISPIWSGFMASRAINYFFATLSFKVCCGTSIFWNQKSKWKKENVASSTIL